MRTDSMLTPKNFAEMIVSVHGETGTAAWLAHLPKIIEVCTEKGGLAVDVPLGVIL